MTAPSIRNRLANAMLIWSLLWSVGVAVAVGLAAQHEVNELLDETRVVIRAIPHRDTNWIGFAAQNGVRKPCGLSAAFSAAQVHPGSTVTVISSASMASDATAAIASGKLGKSMLRCRLVPSLDQPGRSVS